MSGNSSVLVLEDNDFVRMQIVKFLRDGNYETLEANSVEGGMAILRSGATGVSCVLVDVRMEPEDGFDFLQKLRAENINTPTILVTGDQNNDILSRAMQMGVASVLMKPVDKDRLLKMVHRAISTSSRAV